MDGHGGSNNNNNNNIFLLRKFHNKLYNNM